MKVGKNFIKDFKTVLFAFITENLTDFNLSLIRFLKCDKHHPCIYLFIGYLLVCNNTTINSMV